MKRVIIILVIFSLLWVFEKHWLPKSFVTSEYGHFLDAIYYPLEAKVGKVFHAAKDKSKIIKMAEINAEQLIKLVDSAKRVDVSPSFIFLYKDPSMISKKMLADINSIIRQHPNLVDKFFIVAVNDDQKKISDFVNSFDKVLFVPYITSEKGMSPFISYLATKNGTALVDFPLSLYKKSSESKYIEISTGFFTNGRIIELIKEGR